MSMTRAHPHFIIIGAPKCGTSWLAATLGQHPNLIVVPDEIEYFTTHRRNPVDWYLDKFDEQIAALSPVKTAPFVLGEKSAAYCIMPPQRIRNVHRLLPDVRLVLMLRDPVAILWSNMKRRLAKQHYVEREGGDLLSIPRNRLFELLEQTRRFGELGAMIDNWTAVYPAEQLLLVSQAHTLADPRATVDAVLEHVGVSTQYDPAAMTLLSKQKNRGPAIEMPDDVRDYLEEMVGAEREILGEIFRDAGVVNAASMPERPGRADAVGRAHEADQAGEKPARTPEEADRKKRARFLAGAKLLTTHVSTRVGDEIFFVSTEDAGVGRALFINGSRPELDVLGRAVDWLAENGIRMPDEPVIVDVGANIGTTTVTALRRHGFASAVALEPSPENVRTLRLNVAANGLEARVRIIAVAASDHPGVLELDVSPENQGSHRIVADDAAKRSPRTVQVEAVTLDGLVADGVIAPERVGLLWIDAQKHDAWVLAGALRLLEAGPPIVVAIRHTRGSGKQWFAPPAIRDAVIPCLIANYTEIVDLRSSGTSPGKQYPIAALGEVVDSYDKVHDLLFVKGR